MAKISGTTIAVIVGILSVCTIIFITGYKAGSAGQVKRDEARFDDIRDINTKLTEKNTELTRINKALSDRNGRNEARLAEAAEYLGGIEVQLATADSALQRAKISLQYVTEALRIIFEDD